MARRNGKMTRQWALFLAVPAAFAAVILVASLAWGQTPVSPPCHREPLAVVVDLNNDRQAPVIDHAHDAVLNGQPRVLHIDRADANAHRIASLSHTPTRSGFDRDEYPPAASQEGGAGASVRYISPRANRSAGSTMGRALAPFCDGQAFILEPGTP